MQRAGHVPTSNGPGDVGTEARDMSGVSQRHYRFLKGATGPSAKAEKDLRLSTSSEVEVSAFEVQTTLATSRLASGTLSRAQASPRTQKISRALKRGRHRRR